MEIVYYPNMYITSEETLKALMLFWQNINTIVPPSQLKHIEAYFSGQVKNETHSALEKYKEIQDLAGESIVNFLTISERERDVASSKMFDLISNWNKEIGFYNSLKIRSKDDLIGNSSNLYWFLNDKIEESLVELLLEEQLVVKGSSGEIIGHQEIGKSYMSIIAGVIKTNRNARLITDDEFYVAAKSGVDLVRSSSVNNPEKGYQLISLAIPQVFIPRQTLEKLSLKKVIEIRHDLIPLAEQYYQEVEKYQQEINSLVEMGRDEEAFDKLREFCERVSISFTPFSKEASKIFKFAQKQDVLGYINGILLSTLKLMAPNGELDKICDTAVLSSTAGQYILSSAHPQAGFEYLENLNRKLSIERLKGMVTCIVPKTVKKLPKLELWPF